MSKKCTFIGNSNITPSEIIISKAKAIVIDLIEKHKVTIFYCGGYSTFNSIMAHYINTLKNKYKNIKSFYITPYIDEYTLSNIDKDLYDEIIFPELESTPYRYRITKRNMWIINNVDYLIAFIQHSFGGAYKTWEYAKSKKHITKYLLQCPSKKNY